MRISDWSSDACSSDLLEVDTDRISFTVDEVGEPVLVEASYFPNWRVSGADGPYRVAPNLMVVVPTDEQVEPSYGREPIELFAYLMTLGGRSEERRGGEGGVSECRSRGSRCH